ncbi:ABC transporter ATP-binding protein [Thalassotalea insulae]|uniref:ABC transporter ATP-binding protein n=1 Tax=Thalassotalea insulae TaxID=2056778 RepID=A0ABQ6GW03_9GAMM|nr:ABC transporter permease [Thalassotalea insulae]GLX78351.1 ABC transporter ATP-binding protein [Thalassotalea insulae]
MFSYNLQLAINSLKERMSLTVLTVVTIAIGLGLYTTVKTIGYQSSQIPLPHKSQNIYLVQMDNREITAENIDEPMEMVDFTYKDTINLMELAIPGVSQTFFWSTYGILNVEEQNITPIRTRGGVTSSVFFDLVEMPFVYGQGWDKAADQSGQAIIVISKLMNDQLFGGVNSVGQTVRIGTNMLTIAGVYDDWENTRKFYNRSYGTGRPDNYFIPYSYALNLNMPRSAVFDCWAENASISRSFRTKNKEQLLNSECAWITFWAEIPNDELLTQYKQQLNNYVASQKSLGRFPREIKTYVTNLDEQMAFINANNGYIQTFSLIATLFFAVCLLNAIGIMLAKFMRKTKEVSLRRALGAKKFTIINQYILEVIIIGLIGGVLGILVAYLGLEGMMRIRLYASDYTMRLEDIVHYYQLDTVMIFQAFITSVLCTLVVSIYPIWRLCNIPPASQLKSQ